MEIHRLMTDDWWLMLDGHKEDWEIEIGVSNFEISRFYRLYSNSIKSRNFTQIKLVNGPPS